MLSESVIICCGPSSTTEKKSTTPSAAAKDAAIVIHGLKPSANIRQLFKKSSAAPNCVAVTDEHIFAAQADKAIVNVYSRERGNQECLVPFQEKVTALTIACDGTLVVMGTEAGRLMLWETCTGRLVTTLSIHLQTVTCLAVSGDSLFIVSGSSDSLLHTWSIPALLNFGAGSQERSPVASMTSHRAGITALAISDVPGPGAIAVSASSDGNATIFEYARGDRLRTFILTDAPTSLVLDPADRGFFAGFQDGSVELVDFYDLKSEDAINGKSMLHTADAQTMPIQTPASSHWPVPSNSGSTPGAVLSIGLSWDGMTLLSGHANGQVTAWDVGRRSWQSNLVTMAGPVTNLQILPMEGLSNDSKKRREIKVVKVVKPKFEIETQQQGNTQISSNYTMTAQLLGDVGDNGLHGYNLQTGKQRSKLQQAFLCATGFPTDTIKDSLAELVAWKEQSQGSTYTSIPNSAPPVLASTTPADFMELETDDSSKLPAKSRKPKVVQAPELSLEEHNTMLRKKFAALQRVQRVTFKQLDNLRAERDELLSKREEPQNDEGQQAAMDVDEPSAQLTTEAAEFIEAEQEIAAEERSGSEEHGLGEDSESDRADEDDNNSDIG